MANRRRPVCDLADHGQTRAPCRILFRQRKHRVATPVATRQERAPSRLAYVRRLPRKTAVHGPQVTAPGQTSEKA